MEGKEKQAERFAQIWKRVEAARPKLEGSARLMPRKEPKSFARRFIPPER